MIEWIPTTSLCRLKSDVEMAAIGMRCKGLKKWWESPFRIAKKARVCVRPLLPGAGHVVVEKKRQMKEVEAAYTPKMNYIFVCTIRTVWEGSKSCLTVSSIAMG